MLPEAAKGWPRLHSGHTIRKTSACSHLETCKKAPWELVDLVEVTRPPGTPSSFLNIMQDREAEEETIQFSSEYRENTEGSEPMTQLSWKRFTLQKKASRSRSNQGKNVHTWRRGTRYWTSLKIALLLLGTAWEMFEWGKHSQGRQGTKGEVSGGFAVCGGLG